MPVEFLKSPKNQSPDVTPASELARNRETSSEDLNP